MGKSTIWSKLNRKSKNKKTAYEISKETNIPEEKVNEILKGERQLPNDRVDSFTEAIQKDNKVEKTLNMLTIKKWYKDTNLKDARLRLGYKTQVDLAKALNVDVSTINRLENRKAKTISDSLLMKYYDFLNDDLNKVIEKEKVSKQRKSLTREEKEKIKNAEYEKVISWWREFDLKAYLKENNLSHKDLATKLGYNSGSTICDLVNMTRSEYSLRKVITRLYLYLNNEIDPNKGANKEDSIENDKVVEETKNESNSTTSVGYYRVLEEDEDPFEEYVPKHSTITNTNGEEYTYSFMYDADVKLKMAEDEIELLKEKITRYEKIIDKLLEK